MDHKGLSKEPLKEQAKGCFSSLSKQFDKMKQETQVRWDNMDNVISSFQEAISKLQKQNDSTKKNIDRLSEAINGLHRSNYYRNISIVVVGLILAAVLFFKL